MLIFYFCVYTNGRPPVAAEMRKNLAGCPCPTPCQATVYVPSLSFASISTDDDIIKSRQVGVVRGLRKGVVSQNIESPTPKGLVTNYGEGGGGGGCKTGGGGGM